MQFQTIEFFCFLSIVFATYWMLGKHSKWQNLWLLAASYFFYGWWDWRFLFLIAGTSLASYLSGWLMGQKREQRRFCRGLSTANIVANLGILGLYKYFDFFSTELAELLAKLGMQADLPTLNLILPVGISFYTFQALSYSIDVYRQKIEPTRNIVDFFAYISFFPQLVAGPIERATNLLPQFEQRRRFDYKLAADGGRQILWGLFKKLVVADNCARYVDMAYADYANQSAATLWVAAVLFAIQIYGDFSGYSDIAIGTAKLFGFKLMQNFRTPYFSRDIAEFWRRWHISLTTWFRDYLYIPLGGSRTSKAKVARNTMVIFLVSGLWHGAKATFIVWGLYHAILFLPSILLGRNRRHTDTIAAGRLLPNAMEIAQMGTTFLLVVIGWIFFRSDYIGSSIEYIAMMLTRWDMGGAAPYPGLGGTIMLIGIGAMLAADWIGRNDEHALQKLEKAPARYRWATYAVLLLGVVYYFSIGYREPSPFIYFQF